MALLKDRLLEEIDWGKVLVQGERFCALLQTRAPSYGPEYARAVSCPGRGVRRARIEWGIDLHGRPCGYDALP